MSETLKFTFKRKQQKQQLINQPDKEPEDTEFINDTNLLIEKPRKRKKTILVIPNQGNAWKPGKGINLDDLTNKAISEILTDPSSLKPDESTKKIKSAADVSSSLKFPGVVPQKESSIEDYEEVPISDFGAALMRGMGWEKGKGVGRNRKIVEPVNFETKKRTLGVTIHEEESAEAEKIMMEFNLGDYIEIAGGQQKGKHAKILSLSLETGRCIVRLPNDEVIDLAGMNMLRGSREEYLKLRDQEQDNLPDVFTVGKKSKSKKIKDEPIETNGGPEVPTKPHSSSRPWLHRDLMVRIVCQKYAAGKYYCKKVTVVDIIDPYNCTCRDDRGKLLEEVPQSILETVIPKKKGSAIMLLSKTHRFVLAELEEKDSKAGTIICVTMIEKDVVQAPFSEACLYIGNTAYIR